MVFIILLLFYYLFFVHRIDPFIFDHVEPFVGFGDLGGGHLDHVGQGGLCANRGKLIYHEETLAWKTRFVKHFSDIFFTFFRASSWRLHLTTTIEVKKNRTKKCDFFLRKYLTTCAGRGYNGVSQGDTPLPPRGGGGGDSKFHAKVVGTLYAVPYCITIT